MNDTLSPLRPPIRVIILYAMGQLGWSLAVFGASNLLAYFYFPGEGESAANFPLYISQGAVLGIFTVLGLINFGGRIFDAITDPLIGNWSDRLESRLGKRRFLMGISAIPFAVFSVLIFIPLSSDNLSLNTIWLFVTIFIYYLSLTLYVVPYNALIGELGHHPDDRLRISTTISLTWAFGFLIGNTAYALQANFEQSMDNTTAFQWVMALFGIISLICMLIPVFFLNEKKYCRQQQVDLPAFQALKQVFANRNFRIFTIADLLYWLSLTFIQACISYYVTILMGLGKEQATLFMTISFLASFALYAPVNWLARRWGKKQLLMIAFPAFALLFGYTFLLGYVNLPQSISFYGMSILSAIPIAIFSILPNAIIADIIYEQEASTGQQQSGLFFAARNFMMKLGIGLANLIFPSILLLGKSTNNPFGIQMTALVAFVFCVLGFIVFSRYQEVKQIHSD